MKKNSYQYWKKIVITEFRWFGLVNIPRSCCSCCWLKDFTSPNSSSIKLKHSSKVKAPQNHWLFPRLCKFTLKAIHICDPLCACNGKSLKCTSPVPLFLSVPVCAVYTHIWEMSISMKRTHIIPKPPQWCRSLARSVGSGNCFGPLPFQKAPSENHPIKMSFHLSNHTKAK